MVFVPDDTFDIRTDAQIAVKEDDTVKYIVSSRCEAILEAHSRKFLASYDYGGKFKPAVLQVPDGITRKAYMLH